MTVDEFEALPRLSMAALQEVTGIDRRRLRRLLEADLVPLQKYGSQGRGGRSSWTVDRVALRRICPDFYNGILERLAAAGVR
jgi:hypothetical protein